MIESSKLREVGVVGRDREHEEVLSHISRTLSKMGG